MKNDRKVTAKNYYINQLGKTAPVEERIFTVNEIANICGCSTNNILVIEKKIGCNYIRHKPTHSGGSFCDITYSDYLKIKAYCEERKRIKESYRLAKEKKIQEKIRKEESSLEEMKRLHPLVTDERFFKLEFFPDIVPICFKEMD